MTSNSNRILFFLVFLAGFAVLGVQVALFASFALSPIQKNPGQSALIEVQKGKRPREVSRILRSNGILSSEAQENYFYWLGKLMRYWQKVKAGEYEISSNLTPLEIFSVLGSGVSYAHAVTVIEGENMYEIGAALEQKKLTTKKEFLKLCKAPSLIASLGLDPKNILSLEGFLFPNTYFFNKTLTPEEMIRQMVKQYHAVWGENETKRAKELGLTPYQTLTLASMIEKETGTPQERPLISSVFQNRLKKKMRLQSDPTTIYGIWERYHGNLHKTDLLSANPYNTYFIPGLPLGPIGNPGKDSIQAALYPAESDYLYFVSHNDGTHQFSRSLQEHNEAVQKFQIDPKARAGKTWRKQKSVPSF